MMSLSVSPNPLSVGSMAISLISYKLPLISPRLQCLKHWTEMKNSY